MKRSSVSTIVVVFAIVAGLGSWSCIDSPSSYSGEVESLTIGMEATAVNALIYIAEGQDYFAANGLKVTIKQYDSGLAAVNGMLANEVDVATAAEFVIVGKAFTKDSLQTFASIDRFVHNYVFGRRDRGIEKISDLKGKRIGVPLQTAAEFYLGRFLDLHGMSIRQVTLVDTPPSRAVETLASGELDAVVAWNPNAKAIEDRLGGGAVKWPAQNEQVTYCSAISSEGWATGHPELITRILRSLVQAESYGVSRPEEARAIVKQRLRYDDGYIAAVWPEHQLSVSLDQALVLAMEDEARWMIANNLTADRKTPDFLRYVYVDGLNGVRPKAVNIIR